MRRIRGILHEGKALTGEDTRMSDLFRKKSTEQIHAPEELSDYIRVATPSVWLVLVATTILLVGMLAWSILGTVSVENQDGSTQEVHPIVFVTN